VTRFVRPLIVGVGAALLLPSAGAGAVTVTTRVDPSRASVGVPVTYTVEATFDDAATAARARIVAPTGAFESIGPARLERAGTRVTFTQTIACLGLACVPASSARSVVLPGATVVGAGVAGAAAPASVTVVPRVPAAAVAARVAPYRRQVELPDASLRASPRRLALVAAAAAGALLLAACALVVIELRRRRRDVPRDGDELDRAVRLLRESTGRSTADRRRAAGLLGRVARDRVPAVVAGADRVAWSRPEPDGRAAGQLADRAEAEAR